MTRFTTDYANLNDEARDMLVAVARSRGSGMPGDYTAGPGSARPLLSLIAGPCVVLIGVGLALASQKAPEASAMLITAAIMTGGWLILYPFRVWTGHLGTFRYRDEHAAFDVRGREVTVSVLDDDGPPVEVVRHPSSLPRLVLILAIGAGVFGLSLALLRPLQDDMAYRAAANHGVQGYRDYLLDTHHTRHRDDAREKIVELYAPLRAKAAAARDANERDGFTAMIDELSETEGVPVVSLRVSGDPAHDSRFRTWLADHLGSYYGPEFIAFVEAPADVKAHLDVTYGQTADGDRWWRLEFRRTPESEPVIGPWHVTNVPFGDTIPPQFSEVFFITTFGTPAPKMHTAPVEVEDE